MYAGVIVGEPVRYGSHVAVRRIEDLEFLIQESEIATGQPGREFFALRPQPARYRVGKRGAWFEVRCMDGSSASAATVPLSAQDLAASPIGQAMADGRLFCDALQEGSPC